MSDDEERKHNENKNEDIDEDDEKETLENHLALSEENKSEALKRFFEDTKEYTYEVNEKFFVIRCTNDVDLEDIGYKWPVAFINDFGTAHAQNVLASVHLFNKTDETFTLVAIATISDKYQTSTMFYLPDYHEDLSNFIGPGKDLYEIIPDEQCAMHFDTSEAPCEKNELDTPLLERFDKSEYLNLVNKYNTDSFLLKLDEEDGHQDKKSRIE